VCILHVALQPPPLTRARNHFDRGHSGGQGSLRSSLGPAAAALALGLALALALALAFGTGNGPAAGPALPEALSERGSLRGGLTNVQMGSDFRRHGPAVNVLRSRACPSHVLSIPPRPKDSHVLLLSLLFDPIQTISQRPIVTPITSGRWDLGLPGACTTDS